MKNLDRRANCNGIVLAPAPLGAARKKLLKRNAGSNNGVLKLHKSHAGTRDELVDLLVNYGNGANGKLAKGCPVDKCDHAQMEWSRPSQLLNHVRGVHLSWDLRGLQSTVTSEIKAAIVEFDKTFIDERSRTLVIKRFIYGLADTEFKQALTFDPSQVDDINDEVVANFKRTFEVKFNMIHANGCLKSKEDFEDLRRMNRPGVVWKDGELNYDDAEESDDDAEIFTEDEIDQSLETSQIDSDDEEAPSTPRSNEVEPQVIKTQATRVQAMTSRSLESRAKKSRAKKSRAKKSRAKKSRPTTPKASSSLKKLSKGARAPSAGWKKKKIRADPSDDDEDNDDEDDDDLAGFRCGDDEVEFDDEDRFDDKPDKSLIVKSRLRSGDSETRSTSIPDRSRDRFAVLRESRARKLASAADDIGVEDVDGAGDDGDDGDEEEEPSRKRMKIRKH
ncbi:uncharacterized protein JCM6883_007261 [Sporobolomyces salmoneus]|uniref:uncharacterized protein n=1 Tax=Sporobolomyces salmoneus TaxID=183962 RepID=UPI00317E4A60